MTWRDVHGLDVAEGVADGDDVGTTVGVDEGMSSAGVRVGSGVDEAVSPVDAYVNSGVDVGSSLVGATTRFLANGTG